MKESHVGKAKNQLLPEELTTGEPKEFLPIAPFRRRRTVR